MIWLFEESLTSVATRGFKCWTVYPDKLLEPRKVTFAYNKSFLLKTTSQPEPRSKARRSTLDTNQVQSCLQTHSIPDNGSSTATSPAYDPVTIPAGDPSSTLLCPRQQPTIVFHLKQLMFPCCSLPNRVIVLQYRRPVHTTHGVTTAARVFLKTCPTRTKPSG